MIREADVDGDLFEEQQMLMVTEVLLMLKEQHCRGEPSKKDGSPSLSSFVPTCCPFPLPAASSPLPQTLLNPVSLKP